MKVDVTEPRRRRWSHAGVFIREDCTYILTLNPDELTVLVGALSVAEKSPLWLRGEQRKISVLLNQLGVGTT